MKKQEQPLKTVTLFYDKGLVFALFSLLLIGVIMIASASGSHSQRIFETPYYFIIRHFIYLFIGIVFFYLSLKIPTNKWLKYNFLFLLFALVLLFLGLVFGKEINGSTRWISFGFVTIQVSEPVKLFFFCYLAGYLFRRNDSLKDNIFGFLKPLFIFFLIAVMLLAQPDLGTVVIMLFTTLGVMFLAGSPIWQFSGLFICAIASITFLAVTSEYRLRRITSFLDPWQDPFGSGYQLTQSLMAFGRGGFWGEGLGNSIQKLDYLPEAHTDFIVAIMAEELGFIGISSILALVFYIVYKALKIGKNAILNKQKFAGFFAYSIALAFALQVVVHFGASIGILPTKGLTFPLVSYGGSSLIISLISFAILLRIDIETRNKKDKKQVL